MIVRWYSTVTLRLHSSLSVFRAVPRQWCLYCIKRTAVRAHTRAQRKSIEVVVGNRRSVKYVRYVYRALSRHYFHHSLNMGT